MQFLPDLTANLQLSNISINVAEPQILRNWTDRKTDEEAGGQRLINQESNNSSGSYVVVIKPVSSNTSINIAVQSVDRRGSRPTETRN